MDGLIDFVKTLCMGAFIMVLVAFIIVLIVDPATKISSSKPITPELSTTVRDGRADTTWIYVEPK